MKIALGIEYLGHGYFGWQKQAALPTIQGELEKSLSMIADMPIHLFCAGRTDAGVNATGQVVHFETDVKRELHAWVAGTNTHLPTNIAVCWAQKVDDDFHARFSALSRVYRYVIYNHVRRPAILAHQVTWCRHELNVSPMQMAANYLIGEWDFTSFRSAECESKTAMRHMKRITIHRDNDYIMIEIEANAFLHHMVRNIVGVLLRVGVGLKEPEWMQEILQAKDRRKAAETAAASGLYLVDVKYPSLYSFPKRYNAFAVMR